MQFAFDGHSDNPYLPHNYVPNTIVYTGTHDNATTREWYEDLPEYQRQNFWNYIERAPGQLSGVDPVGLVFEASARYNAPTGCSQSWQRGQNERARPSGGELVLAMF